MSYELHHGDCLDVLPTIAPQSVDAVICDPPYGTTACKWDSVIPFEPMWRELKRIIKPRGAIVLFGSQPFTSALVMSNVKMFRYPLVWRKNRLGRFAQAPYRFLEEHEDILVFSFAYCAHNSRVRMKYNPQGTKSAHIYKAVKKASDHRPGRADGRPYTQTRTSYPCSILNFASDFSNLHPTQKPLPLLEYLICTYTNVGDTVLDFAFGSGTCGHACGNLDRRFVGIEKDAEYFRLGSERIATAYAPLRAMEAAI